jgi:hypothetical protein
MSEQKLLEALAVAVMNLEKSAKGGLVMYVSPSSISAKHLQIARQLVKLFKDHGWTPPEEK